MRTVFLFWRNAHDLKSPLFFRFKENLRPVSRFWELWHSKIRFGQNVLRMTWKADFVQFSWKAHYFPVLKRISGQGDDFENFDAPKCDLAKRAAYDLKRALCIIFMENTLFSRFEENLRLVWRLGELWRSKMRFGQNVLRMTWKERFVQFSWKVHCFPVLTRISGQGDDFKNYDAQKCALFFCFEEMHMTWKAHSFSALKRIWGQFHDFENFDAPKCDLTKTCCAWPEKSVLDNFNEKRTVFPFWREFQASVTILRTLTLKNAHRFSVLKKCAWPEKPTVFPL